MPTYRGVCVELHSQFDIETIPEYFPKPQSYYDNLGITGKVPRPVDDSISRCCVYVAVIPGSQFWISYRIMPPVPEVQIFVFKLFINGAHITTWSTGKEQQWKGKTMFGLYAASEGEDGQKRAEKRVLRWTTPNPETGQWEDVVNAFDPDAFMEVRIYRSNGKKRIAREFEQYADTSHAVSGRGVDLVKAGRAGAEHPKRYYRFALVDPLDAPFMTFRYYYRTWEQMEYLGVTGEGTLDETDNDLPIIEPGIQLSEGGSGSITALPVRSLAGLIAPLSLQDKDGDSSNDNDIFEECGDPFQEDDIRQWDGEGNRIPTPSEPYRLSVPPSLRLDPPRPLSRPLPTIPQKHSSINATPHRSRPTYPVEEWVAKTPSPVKFTRDGITTPPMGRKRGFSAAALMQVVAGAWKRRGASAEYPSGNSGSTAARSKSR